MKKIYIVIAILTLGSCAKELEIEPKQSLSENIALSNDQNVRKAILGAYDAMGGYNGYLQANVGHLWGGDIFLYSELMASDGELLWTGTFNTLKEIYGKQMLVNNANILAQWTGGYNTINICNNVLDALDVVDASKRDNVKGDALFIRASAYFELVRFFAKPYTAGNTTTNMGVPLILTPNRSVTADSYVARATVEQVYQQIVADLTAAETLLPDVNIDDASDENNNERKFYMATKTAAAAILSRVYLAMEDFAKARDAADRVIQSQLYELESNYADAFNNSETNSSEDIFAMQVNDQDGNNSMIIYFAIPTLGGRGDVKITQKHLDLYEDGDERLDMFYFLTPGWRSGKWTNQFGNVSVVRLAEMYLTRAEANFRLGSSIGATPAEDINLIRDRVGLDPIDDADLTLDIILHERKVELAHEGSAIHDIKRLRGEADGLDYDDDHMVFPIPIREININPNLKQNDGYGDV